MSDERFLGETDIDIDDEFDDDDFLGEEGIEDPFHIYGCPMPGCIMAGPHFESECCTNQQMADYEQSLDVRI